MPEIGEMIKCDACKEWYHMDFMCECTRCSVCMTMKLHIGIARVATLKFCPSYL